MEEETKTEEEVAEEEAAEFVRDMWSVAPNTLGRSRGLSRVELARLRLEQEAATRAGMRWQESGPDNHDGKGPAFWRGQQWRTGANGGA